MVKVASVRRSEIGTEPDMWRYAAALPINDGEVLIERCVDGQRKQVGFRAFELRVNRNNHHHKEDHGQQDLAPQANPHRSGVRR